jgi:hypothetical protein
MPASDIVVDCVFERPIRIITNNYPKDLALTKPSDGFDPKYKYSGYLLVNNSDGSDSTTPPAVKVNGQCTTGYIEAHVGDLVTIQSILCPGGYKCNTLTVHKTGDTSVNVPVANLSSFTMPDYAVTIEANFDPLGQPIRLAVYGKAGGTYYLNALDYIGYKGETPTITVMLSLISAMKLLSPPVPVRPRVLLPISMM